MHLHDPQTLYRHWEDAAVEPVRRRPASATRAQWAEMARRGPRRSCCWALSSLMVAEERITTKFSGLVGAYGTEEEATFLATQQVDEARHMQFYARFQDEVVADPAAIADHVARAREQLSPAFAHDLRRGARRRPTSGSSPSPATRRRRSTSSRTYHMVIEGTLGLTAFNFITRYLEREALLPGFVEGYSKIHHDEQRHIGYGTWFLREAVRDDPALGDSVRADAARPAARGRRGAHAAGPRAAPTGTRSARAPTRSATSRSRGSRGGSTIIGVPLDSL